jgi:hypothetical protein
MTYPLHIAALYQKHVTDEAPGGIATLLSALGCQHIVHGNEIGRIHSTDTLITPDQPAAEFEPLIRTTLVRTLHPHVNRAGPVGTADDLSLMDGLLRNNRWKACLQTRETAFDLGLLLLYFFEVHTNTVSGQRLFSNVGSLVSDVANAWLRPEISFVMYDDIRTASYQLALELFGEAWGTIALSETSNDPASIPMIIRTQRPAIMEYLLPPHLHQAPVPLPSLEIL